MAGLNRVKNEPSLAGLTFLAEQAIKQKNCQLTASKYIINGVSYEKDLFDD